MNNAETLTKRGKIRVKRSYRFVTKTCPCGTEFEAAHQRTYCDTCQIVRRDSKLRQWKIDNPPVERRCAALGITLNDYQKTLEQQNNLCAICKRELDLKAQGSGNSRAPHFDHDHVTGAFRGILCGNCNRGLGQLGDNLESVLSAVEYLTTSWKDRRVSVI